MSEVQMCFVQSRPCALVYSEGQLPSTNDPLGPWCLPGLLNAALGYQILLLYYGTINLSNCP